MYNTTESYYLIYWGLPLLGFVITLIAQLFVTGNYNKYKKIKNTTNITGYDAARKILDKNGLKDIMIIETRGNLTDHYDPTRKVIRLSTDIFKGNTIASVAVAAHECGHALQDKDNYSFMRFRSFLVPIVNISSRIGYFAIFIGLFLGAIDLAVIGLILLMAMLLFQLITLPVEFNASSRAKKEIEKLHLVNDEEQKGVKNMLNAAAMTYVASLVTILLQVLRLALMIFSRNRD